MKNFNDLVFTPHSADNNGKTAKMFFQNGYGISVIQCYGSYGNSAGLWEAAVLIGDKDDWELCYTTLITEDVLGHLTDSDVSDLMQKIQAL